MPTRISGRSGRQVSVTSLISAQQPLAVAARCRGRGPKARQVAGQLLGLGADPALREWGLRMLLVSRSLERIGDHAVDIGEQTAFLVTGEFREFTDASRSPTGEG
jgi:hypothetical protein